MIVPKAPPVLLFSLDKALSNIEINKIKSIESMTEPTAEQIAEKRELLDKMQKFSSEKQSWIPIPLETVIVPIIPQSYKTTSIKKIDMYENLPYLRQSMNTESITFISSSNIFINALIFALDFMFQNSSAFPSIRYFSSDMIILNGKLLTFSHSKNTNGDEQAITIEVQKGLPDDVIKVKEVKDCPKVVPTFTKKKVEGS